MIGGRSVNVSVTGVIGAMVAGGELEEVNRRLTAATMVLINAGSRVGEALLAARAAQLRTAAHRSDEQARRVRAQVAAARHHDALVWRAASRRSWWRHASAHDVARAWQAAHAWHQVDPAAGQALQRMRAQLAERGVAVQTGSASPADVRWLSTALQLADSEQQAGDRRPVLGLEHTDADRARFAQLLREQWEAPSAEAVIGDAAWSALAMQLHELEVLGGDVPAAIAQMSMAGVRDPAALARWHIEASINTLVADTPAGKLPAVAAEALATLDQQPAREAALQYASGRLATVHQQLGDGQLQPQTRDLAQAHAQRLGRLVDELPASADVVASIAAHEPAMLGLLREGPVGELAARRTELAGAPAARAYRSPQSMSTKDLLAAAYPSSTQQAVSSGQQARQSAAPPDRSRSTERGQGR